MPKPQQWKDFEYFDTAWKERVALMASHIPVQPCVIADIGCGQMWLKDLLHTGCTYYGIDYVYRGPGSHVFDLNNHEFPDTNFDTAFVSGCLEYIYDYEWLISQIAIHASTCIISYCITDTFKNAEERISLGWVNHLSEPEITALFEKHHMSLIKKDKTSTSNAIYVFSK